MSVSMSVTTLNMMTFSRIRNSDMGYLWFPSVDLGDPWYAVGPYLAQQIGKV